MFQTMQIMTGGFDFNFSYFAVCGRDALIVDPCGDTALIRRAVEEMGDLYAPRYILLTHSHRDHVSGICGVQRFFPAPVCISAASAFPCDRGLEDGERLPFGDGFVECLATPGHTVDSMCFRNSGNTALFTGDSARRSRCSAPCAGCALCRIRSPFIPVMTTEAFRMILSVIRKRSIRI